MNILAHASDRSLSEYISSLDAQTKPTNYAPLNIIANKTLAILGLANPRARRIHKFFASKSTISDQHKVISIEEIAAAGQVYRLAYVIGESGAGKTTVASMVTNHLVAEFKRGSSFLPFSLTSRNGRAASLS